MISGSWKSDRSNSSDKRLLRRVSTQRLLPESTHLRSRLLPSLRDDQIAEHTRTKRNSLRAAENWNLRKLSSKADRRSAFLNGSVSAQARRRVNPIPKVRRKRKKRRKKKRRRKKSRFSTES